MLGLTSEVEFAPAESGDCQYLPWMLVLGPVWRDSGVGQRQALHVTNLGYVFLLQTIHTLWLPFLGLGVHG